MFEHKSLDPSQTHWTGVAENCIKIRTNSKLFCCTFKKLLRNILYHHPAIYSVSPTGVLEGVGPSHEETRKKFKAVISSAIWTGCLPLFQDGSLPANCSPLSTAGSQGVIHWRPYDLASQSMKFLHWPALPAKLCWLALSRYVRLDGCTLANFLTQISLYLPYFSISLLEISGNGHLRHFFMNAA